MKKIIFLPISVGVAVIVAQGCLGFVDICEYGPCGSDGAVADGTLPDGVSPDTSIPDGNVPDSEPPPGCLTPDEPLKNVEKCLVDGLGAYVSPTGDDGNPGTKSRPYKTIAKAIGTTQARILVCEGSYGESLEIARNVTLISGMDCAFSRAGGKAKITAAKPEFAVSIAKPASAVQLREVEIEAIDGTSASVNSIALLVNEVASVKLVGLNATAKKGFDAAKGDDGAIGAIGDVGKDAVAAVPGTSTSKVCNSVTTSGGAGGASGGGGQGGTPAIPENPTGFSPPRNGAGGKVGTLDCFDDGFGHRGAIAADTVPAAVATSPGVLNTTWVPSAGTDGATGRPGQGGGGGSGITGGGGGGGTGGCGGTGGKGGQGGGASMALISRSSTVSLESVALKAGAGGAGGGGGAGGAGGLGGNGGGAGANGCQAGNGGQGAKGGPGSGGAGGISVAILYKGTKPTGQATLSFGTVGAPGVGGSPGTNDGPAGVAQNELEVP